MRLFSKLLFAGLLVEVGLLAFLLYTNHSSSATSVSSFIFLTTLFFVISQFFKAKKTEEVRGNLSIYHLTLLIVAGVLVYWPIFTKTALVWGDAPYFFPEGLKELVNEPLAWEARGILGETNNLFWIYPLMFLYGLLHKFLSLGNDTIIRLIFIVPSVLLAFISPAVFTRYLRMSGTVQFFSSLVFGANTYFLLLLDGGQVGVALAYSLLPLTLLFLIKFFDKPNITSFVLALLFFLLNSIADARMSVISVMTFLFYFIFRKIMVKEGVKFIEIKTFALFVILGIAVNLYWLIPTYSLVEKSVGTSSFSQQPISLLNSLLLFQPHWPNNEFGKTSAPFFYFALVPILMFSAVFFRRTKATIIYALCFMLFAFLTKGENAPLGQVYSWFLNLPFGYGFRDSTKFFAPTILFGGILIGVVTELLKEFLQNRLTPLHKGVTLLVCLYLVFLIHPAILGLFGRGLNGALSGRPFPEQFQTVADRTFQDKGNFRTLWFPERHPFSYQTWQNPAVDARTLVDTRLFATHNTGTFDRFNFLHNPMASDILSFFGFKYLFVVDDTRRTQIQEDLEARKTLLTTLSQKENIEKINWGIDTPVYSIKDPSPRVFQVDEVVAVVGGDDIYQKLKGGNPNFSLTNQGFLFFEDGKLNPQDLEEINPESLVLVFNNKDATDLQMSFLQEYFASSTLSTGGWAKRSTDEFLRWKYEFLVNGVETNEFDYGKGVAFSTQSGEFIYFNIDVPEDGVYILAVRSLTKDVDTPLEGGINASGEITYKASGKFEWHIKSGYKLSKGKQQISFKNNQGFHALNTLALIPENEFEKTRKQTEEFINKFGAVNLSPSDQRSTLEHLLVKPTFYKVRNIKKGKWVVFTDNYHPLWSLTRGGQKLKSLPLYSSVNGFYGVHNWDRVNIEFQGQKVVRWGLYLEALAILAIAIVVLFVYSKKR